MKHGSLQKQVNIAVNGLNFEGNLAIPQRARGLVVFAHGSGSSRLSPRNNFVAEVLCKASLGTLLFDLLTEEEDEVYENRFDIPLLAERLTSVTHWIQEQPNIDDLSLGYFGASTGAAAALIASANLGKEISAVVSRGGRPDLAKDVLNKVKSPTLLIVGGDDKPVIELNQLAFELLNTEKKLEIVPGATHLLEEPGTLEKTANLAAEWFIKYLSF